MDATLSLPEYEEEIASTRDQRLQWWREDRFGMFVHFGTPEGHVKPEDRDWEACMTFNNSSWGYLPSDQVAPDSYNARGILQMLNTACAGAGNLLLNIRTERPANPPEGFARFLSRIRDRHHRARN